MAKDFSKSFYNSARWRKCRESYIRKVHSICERCGEPGLILHHKILLTPDNINDDSITLNHDNLEYVCLLCHNIDELNEHGRHKKQIQYTQYRITENGDVIPP